MAAKTALLIGTRKGAFVAESADRKTWDMRGPFCDTWPINHIAADPETGFIYGAGGNEWFGPAVWKSEDLGRTWTHSSEGMAYAEGEEPVKAAWSVNARNGHILCGVQPAGLFESFDHGKTWSHVKGLRDHPSRPEWSPGAGGLILHSLVRHPTDSKQLWIGISAAGVFYTADGGKTWEHRNKGTRADFFPKGQNYPEFGQCVHCLVMAAGQSDLLYQQNHCGMYRSEDGGRNWISIEKGLPSTFGFPAAAHPRDPDTLFLLPLNGDIAGRFVPEGRAAVWRTRDRGQTWQDLRNGLPQEDAYFGVLRQAMATDSHEQAGVYFGTSGGALFGSADEGDNWSVISEHLPGISSVETLVVRD